MKIDDGLKRVAKELFWWQTPEVALAYPRRFLGQVMTLGTWQEVQLAGPAKELCAFDSAPGENCAHAEIAANRTSAAPPNGSRACSTASFNVENCCKYLRPEKFLHG